MFLQPGCVRLSLIGCVAQHLLSAKYIFLAHWFPVGPIGGMVRNLVRYYRRWVCRSRGNCRSNYEVNPIVRVVSVAVQVLYFLHNGSSQNRDRVLFEVFSILRYSLSSSARGEIRYAIMYKWLHVAFVTPAEYRQYSKFWLWPPAAVYDRLSFADNR